MWNLELVLPSGFSQPLSSLSQEMTSEEQEIIKDLEKCDFREIHKYFVDKNEARKALPKEEKQVRAGSYDEFLGPVLGILAWCCCLSWFCALSLEFFNAALSPWHYRLLPEFYK